MSLGQKRIPDAVMPVNNPVPIVYDSSFGTEDGFRYKIEIRYNQVWLGPSLFSYDTFNVWIHPDGTTSTKTGGSNPYAGYGVYDLSMFLSDLIGSDPLNYNVSGATEAEDSLLLYNWSITEYIGTTSGETWSLTGDSTENYWVFRGVKQYGDYWTMGNYIPRNGIEATFLSTRKARKYKLTDTAVVNTFLGDFRTVTGVWDKVLYEVVDIDGSTDLWYYTPSGLLSNASIYTIPIGPSQINYLCDETLVYNWYSISPATSDIINSNTKYYNVYLVNGNVQVTEKIKIDVDQTCYKHDGVKFVYLGDLSTFETYTFRMADQKGFSTSRTESKKNIYSVSASDYSYTIGDRGRKNINVRSVENHAVVSDWIKDDEAEDLMELFRSPEVYVEIDSNLYPVIITTASYEQKTVNTNKLFNYTIEYEMAFEKLSNV